MNISMISQSVYDHWKADQLLWQYALQLQMSNRSDKVQRRKLRKLKRKLITAKRKAKRKKQKYNLFMRSVPVMPIEVDQSYFQPADRTAWLLAGFPDVGSDTICPSSHNWKKEGF